MTGYLYNELNNKKKTTDVKEVISPITDFNLIGLVWYHQKLEFVLL